MTTQQTTQPPADEHDYRNVSKTVIFAIVTGTLLGWRMPDLKTASDHLLLVILCALLAIMYALAKIQKNLEQLLEALK